MVEIEIREPIWLGGKRHVGIAEWKLRGADMVKVRITYRDRHGDLVYPNPFTVPVSKVMMGKREMRQGIALRWVAIEDMKEIISANSSSVPS